MRSHSADGGFTLVELLVAAVLLATGLAAAAAAFSAATRAQAAALTRTTEARLAQAKLAELQATGTTSGASEGTFDELDAGQVHAANDLSDYHYRWEIDSTDLQGLARGQVSVWYRDNEQHPYTLIWYPLSP
jgi:prepilin-type N-terminal cleavage/methylation domain-containing protein